MERDEDGRRWFVPYLHQPPRRTAGQDLRCPDHPGRRMVRVLGQAWVCLDCIRVRSEPQD